MGTVYVVEDDQSIAGLIGLYLSRHGFTVEYAIDGRSALERLEGGFEPALIVLDLMLPGLDGRGLARRVRAFSDVPILMLTALDDDRDKLEGFELGADDYLTKPFNPNELLARVRAVIRRAKPATETTPRTDRIQFANCEIDPAGRRFLVDGQEVALRSKEFDLLVTFAAHRNATLTRDQLLELVWGGAYDGDTRTVDVHVSRLRERLASCDARVAIDTLRSVGYRLTVR